MKTHVRKYHEPILDVERKANNGNSTNMRLLEHPFRMVVAASFIAGKTTLAYKLLKNSKHVNFQRIIWCYNQYQPLYDTLKDEVQNIEFVRGIPDDISEEYFLNPRITNLIVLDDLMSVVKNDTRMADMFSHERHRYTSVVLILQNIFPQGKASRDIALNSQYLVLFNSPVDRMQIMTLARRIYPRNPEKFMNMYEKAITAPYGNLLVDLRVATPEHRRLIINPLDDIECNLREVCHVKSHSMSKTLDDGQETG